MTNIHIKVEEGIRRACPDFCGAAISTTVTNSSSSIGLWEEIAERTDNLRSTSSIDSIKELQPIEATRKVYRALGKDPSRYRPSGEALMRRVLQGKELYRVDTLVDLINLASMCYGYSIGGFDLDKIEGNSIILGSGKAGEPYEGIGRGLLNIESMPVYRDAKGGIGTPTSDNERTKITLHTQKILVIVNGYDGNKENVRKCINYMAALLRHYANSKEINITEF